MATPSIQFEKTDVTERVLEVIRELLVELGSEGALASLSGQAHLDRDLGLGSLERVELLARLESAFHVRLPDRAVGEANTPDDLVGELVRANANGGAAAEAFSGVRAAVTTQAMRAAARSSPAGGRGVEAAETLLDVLRYRARFDAERPHLIVQDDEGASVTARGGARRHRSDHAADVARVLSFVRRDFAGGRDSRADLSAVPGGPD